MKETNTENRRLHEQIKKVTISAFNVGQKFIKLELLSMESNDTKTLLPCPSFGQGRTKKDKEGQRRTKKDKEGQGQGN